MNQVATVDDQRAQAIESKINRDVSAAIAVKTGGITFQNAGEVMEYAKMMAVSGSAVPPHLRGQPGACLGIIDDAIRFQTSPYALARKSYFVNDRLAYEAQVLAGIVNAFAPLSDRPDIQYEGDGPDRACIVIGTFLTGAVREYRSPRIKDIRPQNSPLWKNDPDQQLAYYSLRGFARRHCPEILLGIYDVEEMRALSAQDITPPKMPLADRLAGARQSDEAADQTESSESSSSRPDEAAPATSSPGAATQSSSMAPPPAVDGGRSNSPAAEPPARVSAGGSPIEEARKAGAAARHKGQSRKAIPADIKNDEQLHSAWLDGFDTGEERDREPGEEG